MTGYIDFEKSRANNLVLIDHERRSLDTHVLSSHEALLLPDAIRVRDGVAVI